MPRSTETTVDDDTGPGARQVVLRSMAGAAPRPKTSAPASVFAAAAAAKSKREKSYIDPESVEIKTGVPLPAEGRGSCSAYWLLWERMTAGSMVQLPGRQARAMAAMLKKRGLNRQHFALRKLPGRADDMHGIWRLA